MIENWLTKFKEAWLAKDIDAIFSLLTDDIEYWETPFTRLGKDEVLRREWESVKSFDGMELEYSIYSSDDENRKYAVSFYFTHNTGQSGGAYLVGLNKEGLCNYFYRVSMPKT